MVDETDEKDGEMTLEGPPEPNELADFEVELLRGILDHEIVSEIDLCDDEPFPEEIPWRGVILRVEMAAEALGS